MAHRLLRSFDECQSKGVGKRPWVAVSPSYNSPNKVSSYPTRTSRSAKVINKRLVYVEVYLENGAV